MNGKRLQEGDLAPTIDVATLRGEPVVTPPGGLLHLQFRRYVGCPICNLHLRGVARRIDEIERLGIREVAVFHSDAKTMREYQSELPFSIVADPEKALYRKFGVEVSAKAVLSPKAWIAAARGLAQGAAFTRTAEGGRLGLPADFLIDDASRVVALKYGNHADDQWEVDEILEQARRARRPRSAT